MIELAVVANVIGAIAFSLLGLILFTGQIGSLIGRLLLLACLSTAVWLWWSAFYYLGDALTGIGVSSLPVFESIRNLCWFLFSGGVLLALHKNQYRQYVKWLIAGSVMIVVIAIAVVSFPQLLQDAATSPGGSKPVHFIFLTMAILGLLFTEQIYRNTHVDARWGIKHLCLGLLGMFAFDVYLYAEGVLFNRLNAEVWSVRGLANAFIVPLIAISAKRNLEWNINLFVSRVILFRTSALVGVGVYLLLVAVAGYYLKSYGGTWGGALRAALVFGSLLALITIIVSSQTRSRLRLFLAKHFYETKYEYGDVWLGLTDKLSHHEGSAETLHDVTLKAIVDILDSTGGVLWYKDSDGNFSIGAEWVLSGDYPNQIPGDNPFLKTLQEQNETIDLPLAAATLNSENNLIPEYFLSMKRAWLILPLSHDDELLAFLLIAESRSNESLSDEDKDLLKTVSRQAGSYIALLRSTDALSELRQFEAFNQLSAFLVHDLKNVVAQLSLIVRNSAKFGDNPEFIADSFTTISDAVDRMNRMLASLKAGMPSAAEGIEFDLANVVEKGISRCERGNPIPELVASGEDITVRGDPERFLSVIEHLIQNAQDATPISGQIGIRVFVEHDNACAEISDTGSGMDEEFIKTRLFKPFDTTKGKAGMGIGVYESRQIVNQMGGKLSVKSTLGEGATFTITLPRWSSRR